MSLSVCPACGKHAFEPLEFIDVTEQHKLYAPDDQEAQQSLTAAAAETALSYQMLKCNNCGLEFCEPLRAPSAEWYHLAYRAMDLYVFDRWEYYEVLRRISHSEPVFEFGCGSGLFLSHCKEQGVPALGMDFSEDGVAGCVAKGLSARRLDLNEAPSPADSDLFLQMAAFHFLEHLDRPAAFFEHAAAKALPLAHLWVSVPCDRRTSRRFEIRECLDQPPHHMTRWTTEAFREIGKRHGWRLLETFYEPLSMRTKLWWIATQAPTYQRWKTQGRFKNKYIERAFRAFVLPATLVQWLLKDRRLTGHAILAHFRFDIHAN